VTQQPAESAQPARDAWGVGGSVADRPGAGPSLSREAVDRAAERRGDEPWLEEAWQRGQLLTVDESGRTAVVDDGDGPRLALQPAAAAGARDDAWLLGVDDQAVPLWGRRDQVRGPLGARPLGLREVGATLGARDSGLLVTAVALANWHATHRHCPRCGTPTELVQAGWQRHCPTDGSAHFPRTDPAVIVLVHDGGDRCLLGRQPQWPPGRYSTLAGFVESGESAEAAVRREVAEESGVVVDEVTYRSSQPWPFPAGPRPSTTSSRTSAGSAATTSGPRPCSCHPRPRSPTG
jgi:NAD+ diphosphatase